MKSMICLLLAFAVFVMITAGGCGGGPPQTPQVGFIIHTTFQGVSGGSITALIDDPEVAVIGDWIQDIGTANGPRFTFTGLTNGSGFSVVNDGRTPALWLFAENTGACAGQTYTLSVLPQSTVELRCTIIVSPFSISPSSVNAYSPPAVIEMTGSGCDSTYGMPQIVFYDDYGHAVWSSIVSSMSYDGTWLQAPASGIEFLYSGSYNAIVKSMSWDGTSHPVGSASIFINGNDPPPPPPPPCTQCEL
jgi:hypothetical protein